MPTLEGDGLSPIASFHTPLNEETISKESDSASKATDKGRFSIGINKSYLRKTAQLFRSFLSSKARETVIKPALNILSGKTHGSIDSFKELYPSLEKDWSKLEPEQKDLIYNLLLENFRRVEFGNTPKDWVQKADLLDALDFMNLEDPEKFPVISIGTPPPKSLEEKGNELDVPLIRIAQIKKIAGKTIEAKTSRELLEQLGDIGEAESSKMAQSVHFLTSQKVMKGGLLDTIYRSVTIAGGVVGDQKTTTEKLAEHSLDTNIGSIEVVRQEKTEEGTDKVYHYRGPRFLFKDLEESGKKSSVHAYEENALSFNDWFKRDLSPVAREAYLAWEGRKTDKLTAKYNLSPQEQSTAFVIATGDSRVRVDEIKPGDLKKEQTITGKALSAEAAHQAFDEGENISYLSTRFKSLFSVLEVFGFNKSEDMHSSTPLDAKQIDAFKPPKADASPQARLSTIKKNEGIIQSALHAFMRGTYNFLDSKGVVQIVQRLAPQDVHNYVNTVGGKALDPLNAIEKLGTLMKIPEAYQKMSSMELTEEREKLISEGEPADSPKIRQLDQWIPLKQSAEVFQKWKDSIGGDLPATVDFYGGNASVSTPAISNRPEILARNDHKILFFEHDDGRISVHSFIGATGVNDVAVDQTLQVGKKGRSIGFMGFGKNIKKRAGKLLGKAGDKETGYGVKKGVTDYREKGSSNFQEKIEGSTVISWYIGEDYIPRADFQNVKKNVGLIQEGNYRQEIETRVQMGTPMLIETKVAINECLFRHFDLSKTSPEEMTVDFLKELVGKGISKGDDEKKNRLLPQDQMALEKLSKLLTSDNPDDKASLDRVISMMQTRREKEIHRESPFSRHPEVLDEGPIEPLEQTSEEPDQASLNVSTNKRMLKRINYASEEFEARERAKRQEDKK